MELTVCVCVRDGEDYVDRCLAALLRETERFGTPILVVDHLCRDATPERLARWAAEQPQRLRVVRFEEEGLAAARDFAWRQTRTPWLAYVDIDCEVQPGWAGAVHGALEKHAPDPACGAFGGANRVREDGRLLSRAVALLLSTYVGGHDSILNRPFAESKPVDHCPTLNVVYRRRGLEEIGGFDPAYTRIGEDLEVSRRLRQRGYRLWAVPDMVVAHAARASLGDWLRNMFLYGRGRCFHLKRHREERHAKFVVPALVVLVYTACAALAACGAASPLLPTGLAAAHLAGIALALRGEAGRQDRGVTVWLAATVLGWVTHLAYGAGLLFELPRRRGRFVR